MNERPIEAQTDHRCVLGVLTRHLADAKDDDRAALAARALDLMMASDQFDRCCAPRYLALAPDHHTREVQIPIAREGDVETRVIVWPVGARDFAHPHIDGWTVFIPTRGRLATVARGTDGPLAAAPLESRRPVALRPEDGIRHLVRNIGDEPALSIHISAPV